MSFRHLIDPVVTIEDDRGEAHILDRRGWRSSASFGRAQTRFVIDEAIRRSSPGATRESRAAWLLGFLGCVVVFALAPIVLKQVPSLVRIVVVLGALLTVGFVIRRVALRRSSASAVDIMVRNGLCGCCAYDLSGEPDSTGEHVVCPECGAAWRRGRVSGSARRAVGSRVPANARPRQRHASVRKTLEDDRGRWVALLSRQPREVMALTGDPRVRERLKWAQFRVRDQGLGLRLVAAGFCFLGAGACLVSGFVVIGPISLSLSMAFVRALWGPFIAIVMAWIAAWWGVRALRSNLGISPRAARKSMLDRSLCPSCSEELAGVDPEEDGCRVCPTCGAAWRVVEGGAPQPEREPDVLAGLPRLGDGVDEG